MSDKSGIGKLLFEERMRRGESQRVFGARFGMSREYLAQTEDGKPKWPKKYIPAIARALKVSEAELAHRAGVIHDATVEPLHIEEQRPFYEARPTDADLRLEAIQLVLHINDKRLSNTVKMLRKLVEQEPAAVRSIRGMP